MQHLEEGTIHAWIDGALSPVEAREVEAHIATCEACSQLAAEARGLVAASSRILTALDDVPGDVIPIGGSVSPAAAPSGVTPIRNVQRRWYTPMWARTAAAVLVVAGASALVMTAKLNSPERSTAMLALDSANLSAPMEARLDSSAPAATALPAPAAPPQAVAKEAGRDLAAGSAPSGFPGNRVSVPARGSAVAGATAGPSTPSAEQTIADRAVAREEKATQQSLEAAKRSEAGEISSQRAAMTAPTLAGASAPKTSSPALHADTGGLANRVSSTAIIGKAIGAATGRGTAAAPSAAADRMQVFSAPATLTTARGCYAITMSPWSGGTIPFGSPPPRIELDTIRSQAGDLLVHPGRGAASNGATRAFWTQLGDSVYITWENDSRGVRLTLPTYGEVLRGRAETIASTRTSVPQTSDVEARRISCRE